MAAAPCPRGGGGVRSVPANIGAACQKKGSNQNKRGCEGDTHHYHHEKLLPGLSVVFTKRKEMGNSGLLNEDKIRNQILKKKHKIQTRRGEEADFQAGRQPAAPPPPPPPLRRLPNLEGGPAPNQLPTQHGTLSKSLKEKVPSGFTGRRAMRRVKKGK